MLRALGVAIIGQALADARKGSRSALRWLVLGGADLEVWCDVAGLNASRVAAAARRRAGRRRSGDA